MFKWWDMQPVPLFNGEGMGSGGGAGEGAAGGGGAGEGAAGGGGAGEGANDWLAGVSDDDRTFVGERDLGGLIEYARTQRAAAGKRADDVAKEGGFIKPITPTDDAGEFFNTFRPETAKAYAEKLGMKEEEVTPAVQAEMEAALDAGMHVDQFAKMREAREIKQGEIDKQAAETLVADLKQEWGADFDIKSQNIDRAVKEMGLTEPAIAALSNPSSGLSGGDYKTLMNTFDKIGEFLREGGPLADGQGGTDGGGSQTPEQQLTALEEAIVAKGGKATPEQTRQREALLDKIYAV